MALSKVSTNQIDTAATPTVAEATITGDLTVDTNTLHVDSTNNRVGIGTTSPATATGGGIDIERAAGASVRIDDTTNSVTGELQVYSAGMNLATVTNHDAIISTNNTERLRITSDGKCGIGTTSPVRPLTIEKSGAAFPSNSNPSVRLNETSSGRFALMELDSSTNLSIWNGDAGSGSIRFLRGSGSGTESMRIDSSGNFMVGKTTAGSATAGFEAEGGGNGATLVTRSGGVPLILNRLSNDGYILEFRQDNSQEGAINVSGSTVTLVGGHLARWSQATDGNRIDGLVKGTVMTNLDQMAEWTKDGVTEENEQLNCMAVSSVEGDPNVAGVFQNWDDDDEIFTSDMVVAMTGDMVIRIASGTTVARGDLLMSAGDGTAKPQDDDIVRSKTIAKVTSTTVSHTYDDGSYLVPCVLMAC